MKVQAITILMADDDEEDRLLTRKAFELNRLGNDLRFVEDGEDLLDYLYHRGKYTAPADSPRPGLILLDLNMPKVDGREALEVIKRDADLRSIPVVVMTTSGADQDIARSYQLGANSYVTKPVTFESLAQVIKALGTYWFEIVALPDREDAR
ncbi:MAG: response regulator [Polyangiaceae bacterium]|nr:response regulator [Polyangiaceae bacterium]